jgi:hypothetical protein
MKMYEPDRRQYSYDQNPRNPDYSDNYSNPPYEQPHQAQPQYPGYPQYPSYPPPQPERKKMSGALIAVIIVVIVISIILPLLFVGAAYLWVSDIEGDSVTSGGSRPSVGASNPDERSYGWIIRINSISGSTFRIEDAKFRMIDSTDIRLYQQDVSECSPPAFTKGASTIYAIPSPDGDGTVDDGTSTVTGTTSLENYENCAIAFIDQDNNQRVSAGDSIYIYKDTDNDDTDEITNGYIFELLYRDEMVVRKSL